MNRQADGDNFAPWCAKVQELAVDVVGIDEHDLYDQWCNEMTPQEMVRWALKQARMEE